MAAVAYFFLVEQPRHRRQAQDEHREVALSSLDAESIDAVDIVRPDVNIRFELRPSGWRMITPVEDRVEDVKVNTLVRAITDGAIERRLDGGEDLSQYGLDAPVAVVTLSGSQGTAKVSVGALTLTKVGVYVQIAGSDDVLIAPAGIHRYALRTLYDFREKDIVLMRAEDVRRFTVASPSGEMTWLRRGDKDWVTVVRNDTIGGDVNEVEAIVRELRGLRAAEILPADEAGIALVGEPAGKVTIEATGQDPLEVTVGEPRDNSTYISVAGRDRICRVNASLVHIFEKDLENLRDRRLVRFGFSKASTITFETEQNTTSLVRTGNDWSYANPTLGTLDQDAVVELVTRLQNVRLREVLGREAPADLDFDVAHAPFRAAIFADDGSIIDEFAAGPRRTGNVRYAYSRTLDSWGIVDDEALEDLLERLAALRFQ